MNCAECKAACVSGQCHTTGVGVGRFKRLYWVCPSCAKDVLDFSQATDLQQHWLETTNATALKARWGDGVDATAVAEELGK